MSTDFRVEYNTLQDLAKSLGKPIWSHIPIETLERELWKREIVPYGYRYYMYDGDREQAIFTDPDARLRAATGILTGFEPADIQVNNREIKSEIKQSMWHEAFQEGYKQHIREMKSYGFFYRLKVLFNLK
jgi:hypothetical protein